MIDLQPKIRFLKDDAASRKITEITHSADFLRAIETAMAEFAVRQPRPDGLEAACRAHYELIGARKLIDILLNLGEPESNAPRSTTDNLIWKPPSHLKNQPPQPQPK